MSMQAEAVDQEPVEIKEEPIQIDVKVKEEHDEFLEILPSTSKSILDDDKEDLRASLKIEHEQDIKILPSTSKFDSEDDFFDEDQGKKEMPEFKEEMMSEDEDDESDFEQEGLSDDGGEGPSNIKTEELMIKSESGESDSREIDMVSDEDKQYACDRCNYKTQLRTELTKHETAMHAKPSSIGDFMSDYTRYLMQYACDLCEYKTYSMPALKNHLSDCHQTNRRCSRCRFVSDSENEYKKHMLSVHIKDHEKIIKRHYTKNHTCSFCDYKTFYAWALKTHIEVKHDHTAVKKHACQQCDYRSHYKSALTRHISVKHRKNTPDENCTKKPPSGIYNDPPDAILDLTW